VNEGIGEPRASLLAAALQTLVASNDLSALSNSEIVAAMGAAVPNSFSPTMLAMWTVKLREKPVSVLEGRRAFHLYETFGMPLDFMVDAARDAGIEFDHEGFETAKEEEQARARASWKGGSQKSAAPVYRELAKTEFEGTQRCGWMARPCWRW